MLGHMATSDITPSAAPTELLRDCHFDTGISSIEGEYGSNEDYCAVSEFFMGRRLGLTLADGIGSEPHGRTISRIACLASLAELSHGAIVEEAFEAGLKEVRSFLRETGSPVSGAALLVAKCSTSWIIVAYVGDCRVARIRGSKLYWINDPDRVPGTNRLTKVVGADMVTRPTVITRSLAEGDTLVFMTDGVFDTLDDEAIVEAILAAPSSCSAARSLTLKARKNGKDDATVAVVKIQ